MPDKDARKEQANQELEAIAKAKREAAKAKVAYDARIAEAEGAIATPDELVNCLNALSEDVQELTDTVMAIAANVLGGTKAKSIIADRNRLQEERELLANAMAEK